MKNIIDSITKSADEFIAIRRQLHQHPEIGFEEQSTSDFIAQYLEKLGYSIHRGMATTGVVATLQQGDGPQRLGIRADIDALPIHEKAVKPGAAITKGSSTAAVMTDIRQYCYVPLNTWQKPVILMVRCILFFSLQKSYCTAEK